MLTSIPYKGILATMSQDSPAPPLDFHPKPSSAPKRHTPSAAGRSASHSSKYRTEPCKYWANGTCFNGDRCRWRHDGERSTSLSPVAAIPPENALVMAERM